MYRLNNLERNVLITPDEVIFHAPTDHTIDHIKIQHAIIIAEERFIRPALTYELYEQLIAEKNLLITVGNLTATQDIINNALPGDSSQVVLQVGDIVNAAEFMATNSLLLWKQHLWKLTAEAVLLIAVPDAFVQFSSTGIVHAQPTSNAISAAGVVTPDLRSVKWIMDKKLMDRIDPLTEAMHVFLCYNKLNYPNYDRHCDCDSKGIAYKRKTDWVTGIYDSEQNCDCRWDQLNTY